MFKKCCFFLSDNNANDHRDSENTKLLKNNFSLFSSKSQDKFYITLLTDSDPNKSTLQMEKGFLLYSNKERCKNEFFGGRKLFVPNDLREVVIYELQVSIGSLLQAGASFEDAFDKKNCVLIFREEITANSVSEFPVLSYSCCPLQEIFQKNRPKEISADALHVAYYTKLDTAECFNKTVYISDGGINQKNSCAIM